MKFFLLPFHLLTVCIFDLWTLKLVLLKLICCFLSLLHLYLGLQLFVTITVPIMIILKKNKPVC